MGSREIITDVPAHVRRAKAKSSSECKPRPGKGRWGWEAIPAAVEVTEMSEPGRQLTACGIRANACECSFCEFTLDWLESVLWNRWAFRQAYGCKC